MKRPAPRFSLAGASALVFLWAAVPLRAGGDESATQPPTPPPAAPASGAKPAPEKGEEKVATGVGNHFLQTNTPLVNDKGVFEARITHRFRDAVKDAGSEGALGLDSGANVGFWLDYVPVKSVALQVMRVNSNATYEFAAKVTALRPSPSFPVALGLRGGLDWQTAGYAPEKYSAGFGQFLFSLTIADRLTLGAAPTYVQKTPSGVTKVFNVPLTLQLKITDSIAAIGEYIPAKTSKVPDTVGQWSFGIEKAVFHHKFALRIGNSGAVVVNQSMAGDFDGFQTVKESNLRIGFNLIRQFDIATD